MPASPAHLGAHSHACCCKTPPLAVQGAQQRRCVFFTGSGSRRPKPPPPKGSLRGGVPAKPSCATTSSRRAAGAAGGYRHLPGLVLPKWSPLATPCWPAPPTPHKHCRVGLLAAPAPMRELPLSQYACHAAGARHNSPNQGAQASGPQRRFLSLNSRPQSNPQGRAPLLCCMCAVYAARCSAQSRGWHTSHKQTLGSAPLPPHICAPDNTTQMQHLRAPT